LRKLAVVAGLTVLTLLAPQSGVAQTGEDLKAVQKEIEALREGQVAIQKELQEIKQLLRARPAPPVPAPLDIALSVEGAPSKGEPNAKLTLIDFSDYQ